MTGPRITVVGIGEDGLAGLGANARRRIEAARLLVGGDRHLALVPEGDGQERVSWGGDIPGVLARLDGVTEKDGVVVLATGDPLWFGIAERLIARYGPEAVEVLPHVNAFTLAAARMGWGLSDPMLRRLSVHSRPFAALNRELFDGRRLLILSKGAETPAEVAALLTGRGFGDSAMTVLEHMGGPDERRTDGKAGDDWTTRQFSNLNTVAVACRAGAQAAHWPLVPGLPEAAFDHDGKITKREVRAVTLAALGPLPGETLWDVGAGSGSVAIEWLRACPSGRAVAIERDSRQLDRIRTNADRLGAPLVEIVEGEAPAAFDAVDGAPDAIFVGGGISRLGLLPACIDRLRHGGRLVANTVTLEAAAELMAAQAAHGGDLVKIATAHSDSVGRLTALRPAMEVTQWRWRKP